MDSKNKVERWESESYDVKEGSLDSDIEMSEVERVLRIIRQRERMGV